ncbi:MAG: aminotransferase class I/II-fold pyridoxal phosphate-dependent enzyme [Acidimicrobiia bacterium]|nr:aminotransferase class I/II-fold pyridoxal phosphate-dependent enzyme [Acidimicrobiia bacterium]
MSSERIWLSPPDVTTAERDALVAAFDSGWIAPVGPDLVAFESEVCELVGVDHAVALSSGSAALHLALLIEGVAAGDDVIVPSFTFAATAFAVANIGARPCFIDSEADSWNIDPDLLGSELAERAATGNLPAAVISVDLYGQCADYRRLVELCAEYDVALVADSAEALGASRDDRQAGSFTHLSAFSFNGNKILTTGGGGMLVSDDGDAVARARHLATQAREAFVHYEHLEVGFNYRLSNLLAAIGRAQLVRLPSMIERRRRTDVEYRSALGDIAGISFLPVPARSSPNRWLSVMLVEPATGVTPELVRLALDEQSIESRPTWKPMHLQPVFAGAPMRGGAVCENVFTTGLCLPTGSSMTDDQIERVIGIVQEQFG